MSNHQWNPQPPRRDPRQPFGSPTSQTPQQQPSVAAYEPPRSNTRRNIVVGCFVAAIALASVFLLQGLGAPAEDPRTASNGPSLASSSLGAQPTSVPFDHAEGGLFEIVSTSWQTDRLVVKIKVTLNSGSAEFGVQLYDNESLNAYQSSSGSRLRVTAGQSKEATFEFPLPSGDGAIILTDDSGHEPVAIAALPVRR